MVRGLSITRFVSFALSIDGGDNNKIEGNFIGTNPGGIQKGLGTRNGLVIIFGASNNTVGGTAPDGGPSPDKRNIISGNGSVDGDGSGVLINGTGATGNRVQGN